MGKIGLILREIVKFILTSISIITFLAFLFMKLPLVNTTLPSYNTDTMIYISNNNASILKGGVMRNRLNIKLKRKYIIENGYINLSELKILFPKKDIILEFNYGPATVIKSELSNGILLKRINPFFMGTKEFYKISTNRLGNFHYQKTVDPIAFSVFILLLIVFILHLVNICFYKNKKAIKIYKILEIILFSFWLFKSFLHY
jgi:hypothetical protein